MINKRDSGEKSSQSTKPVNIENSIIKQRLDSAAVVFVLLMVTSRFLISTTFGFPRQALEGLVTVSEIVLFVIGLIKIIPLVKSDIKNIYIPIIVVFLYAMFLYRGDDLYSLYGFVLLGTIGISYKRFLKGYVVVSGVLLLITVIASLTGLIPNLLYSGGVTFRDSFGIAYTTDFTSYVFYIFLFFWIAWEKLPHYFSGVLAFVGFVIAKFTDSDTCMICFGMLFVIIILFALMELLVKKYKKVTKAKSILDFFLLFAFPIFAFFIVVLVFLYAKNTGIGETLNRWLSGRLNLTWNSLKNNGISLLGTDIPQIGNGGSTFPSNSKYDFVDSTYPLILIKYGIIFFALVCIMWMRVVKKATKSNNYRLAFGMAFIAFHSLSEHHFIDIQYNILMFLPFASYELKTMPTTSRTDDQSYDETCKTYIGRHSKNALGFGITVVIISLMIVSSKYWLQVFRTIFNYNNVGNGGVRALFFLMCTILLGSIVFFIIGICRFIIDICEKRKKRIKFICFGMVGILLLIVLSIFLVRKTEIDSELERAADNNAYKKVVDSAAGKVFTSKYPLLYAGEHEKLSFSYFLDEDLARYTKTTVIVPRDKELNVFIRSGFVYAPISEYASVYTNDDGVIAMLFDECNYPNAYFSGVKSMNDLGTFKGLDLRAGEYEADIKLKVDRLDNAVENTISADGINDNNDYIGYAWATIVDDDMKIRTVPITTDMVDESSYGTFKFRFKLNRDTRNVKVYVRSAQNTHVLAEDISIRMNPEFDIHKVYDENRLLVKEMYYSSNGSLTNNYLGYAICDREYDEENRLISQSYYDSYENAINRLEGYHECRMDYNDSGIAVRVSYYDCAGMPCTVTGGYSYFEYMYDKAGKEYGKCFYDKNGNFLYVRIPRACMAW